MGELVGLIQNVLNGLLIGAVYAMVGAGLTLIFGVMRTINFAHGDFVVLGMYTAFAFNMIFGLDPYLSLLVVLPAGFVLGVMIERMVLAPIVDKPHETSLLATLGISLIIGNIMLLTFGGESKSVYVGYASEVVSFGEVRLSVILLLAGAVTALVMGGLYLLLHYTEFGRSIRATSENRLGAELVGINTRSVQGAVFGLGIMLAMTAGVALIPLLFATPTATGPILTLKAFVVIVLGGLGRVGAAVAGGLILGVVEVLGTAYISSAYRDAYGLLFFLIILLFKPEGLFGRSVKRV